MDLSIIIVSYRTRERLRECLDAVLAAHGPSREVLVVDNASDDGSAEMVRREYPAVALYVNGHNYGFAVANNQGLRESSGRYVMTLNPDAIVTARSLLHLVDFLDRTPEAALAAPTFVSAEGVPEPTQCRFRPVDVPQLWRILRPASKATPRGPVAVDWIWGTGYVCRRSALDGAFFTEEHFLFGEEYYLCTRLREKGHRLYLVPEAVLHHSVSASYGREAGSFSHARRLGVAVAWRIRRREFGTLVATVNQTLVLADSAFLWLALAGTSRAKRDGLGQGRALGLVDYGARVAASFGVLFRGERYVGEMNEACWRFFNGGLHPPPPPAHL
jgi:GT2 family glycosyltransferase